MTRPGRRPSGGVEQRGYGAAVVGRPSVVDEPLERHPDPGSELVGVEELSLQCDVERHPGEHVGEGAFATLAWVVAVNLRHSSTLSLCREWRIDGLRVPSRYERFRTVHPPKTGMVKIPGAAAQTAGM